mgnify:CR=1 FL=1
MENYQDTFFTQCVADLKKPDGWENTSYGNDVCPSWSVNGWQIFIDHPKPEHRELGADVKRFSITVQSEYGEGEPPVLETDDWENVLAFVAVAKREDSKRDIPKDVYTSDGELGFMHNGVFITNPFVSECGRFPADPIEDYGLTDEQVAQFKADKAED